MICRSLFRFLITCFALFFPSIVHLFVSLELTEFPKIDGSDEDDDDDDDDEGPKHTDNDDDILSNSISSISVDGCSLNNTTNPSGTSTVQTTSDYESFADCLRQSPKITTSTAAATAAPAPTTSARSLTNISFDNYFSVQGSIRVNGEGFSSPSSDHGQRRRKNGTSSTMSKTTSGLIKNETPLLSHLFGTHKYDSDSNLKSLTKR